MFTPNQKVKCINSSGLTTISSGKVYTVIKCVRNLVSLVEPRTRVRGERVYYNQSRFVPDTSSTLPFPFKPGDKVRLKHYYGVEYSIPKLNTTYTISRVIENSGIVYLQEINGAFLCKIFELVTDNKSEVKMDKPLKYSVIDASKPNSVLALYANERDADAHAELRAKEGATVIVYKAISVFTRVDPPVVKTELDK